MTEKPVKQKYIKLNLDPTYETKLTAIKYWNPKLRMNTRLMEEAVDLLYTTLAKEKSVIKIPEMDEDMKVYLDKIKKENLVEEISEIHVMDKIKKMTPEQKIALLKNVVIGFAPHNPFGHETKNVYTVPEVNNPFAIYVSESLVAIQ